MNFLSHFYFERYADSPELVLGNLLPDFLKNVDKEYSFQLSKFDAKLWSHPNYRPITEGWQRHVEIDKIFHSHDFFYEHTHTLRNEIAPIVEDLPVRASFLAHIGLELVLDHLLIVSKSVSVSHLYEQLEAVDRERLRSYLSLVGDVDIARFDRFYDRFMESKYIFEYENIHNIPHALFNICRRVWQFRENQGHIDALAEKLEQYKNRYLGDYKTIYGFITDKIT